MTILTSVQDTKLEGENSLPTRKKSLVIDMTEHVKVGDNALRVEFRRTRSPAAGSKEHTKRIVDSNFIVGLIDENDLPKEGKSFKMPYHSFNSVSDFGSIDSDEPIRDLVIENNCYYFETSEGQWRLKVLDVGN